MDDFVAALYILGIKIPMYVMSQSADGVRERIPGGVVIVCLIVFSLGYLVARWQYAKR